MIEAGPGSVRLQADRGTDPWVRSYAFFLARDRRADEPDLPDPPDPPDLLLDRRRPFDFDLLRDESAFAVSTSLNSYASCSQSVIGASTSSRCRI
jgi:hypothetical protein